MFSVRWIAPVACLVTLSGCFEEAPTAVPGVARVYTVDEYLADPALRQVVVSHCRSDPGQLGEDPNCVNSKSAALIAISGGSGQ